MKTLNKIVFACLLVLVYSIPFELDFGYMGINIPLINTSIEVIAAITLTAWGIEKIINRKSIRSPFDIFILVYLGCNLISIFVADNPIWALKYTLKLSAGILAYYLILDTIKEPVQIKRLVFAILIPALIVSALGFIEKIFIYDLFQYSPFWVFSPVRSYIPGGYGQLRISSTFVYPNILAMYLELVIPLITGLFLFKSTKKIFNIYFFLIIILMLVLIFTYSRAGLIGLFGSLVCICLVCLKNNKLKPRFKMALMLTLTLLLITCITTQFDSILGKRLRSIPDMRSNPSGQRFYLWKNALKTFYSHPILGIGPDNFRWVYAEKYAFKSPFLKWNQPTVIPSLNSNSLYFELLTGLGIIGIIVFLVMMAKIFRYFMKNLLQSDEYMLCISLGIVGSLSSYFIHGIFDSFAAFQPIIFLFWVIIGLGVKIVQIDLIKE